jgi:RNA polymerase sigma factor for flagellar operon FliA
MSSATVNDQIELFYHNDPEKDERNREIGELCVTDPPAVAEKFAYLIWAVIRRMARRLPSYVQCEDLYGVGALGLMDAVEKYDAAKGTSFGSYAAYRIRGAILDELRHRDPMPRVLRSKYKMSERKIERLRQSLGREPVEEEVAEALEVPLDRYQDFRIQVERATTVSYNDALAGYYGGAATSATPSAARDLSATALHEETGNRQEGYGAYRALLRQEKIGQVSERIRQFERRDQLIMALHYKEGLNFRQVGEVLGLTESRISQLHKGIILALRSQLADR